MNICLVLYKPGIIAIEYAEAWYQQWQITTIIHLHVWIFILNICTLLHWVTTKKLQSSTMFVPAQTSDNPNNVSPLLLVFLSENNWDATHTQLNNLVQVHEECLTFSSTEGFLGWKQNTNIATVACCRDDPPGPKKPQWPLLLMVKHLIWLKG